MPITHIDFSELSEREETKGLGLQNLVCSIGRGLKYRVEQGGAGADQGRDLFFTTSNEIAHGLHLGSKILVSCKDKAKSGKQLKFGDLDNFSNRAKQHGCNAYLLVTTVQPTDDLVTSVREIAVREGLVANVWQPDDLREILLNGQDDVFRFTIARFFPKSTERNDAVEQILGCFLESLDLMECDNSLELSLRLLRSTTDPFVMWKCLEKLLNSESVDIESELPEHIFTAVSLGNYELTRSIGETATLQEAVRLWASGEQLPWEAIDVQGIRLDRDGELVIEIESNQYESTMGAQFESINNGTIRWTTDGFEVKKCTNDWEEVRRLGAEFDAESDI
ncbi:MAG: restriction endonuclease [Candidatus Obscuribacter sp.]|nr:restriction endonuclease [Candidatus Obscuribacter sp.]MBP6350922.1 restriction endonuclease [Candidatus Obscuribacter sp.]MBP7575701.1 restriction endonuclease [Candidatus Obscuribacter sp.]